MICEFCCEEQSYFQYYSLDKNKIITQICKQVECFLRAQKTLQKKSLDQWEVIKQVQFNHGYIQTNSQLLQRPLNLYQEDLFQLQNNRQLSERSLQAFINRIRQNNEAQNSKQYLIQKQQKKVNLYGPYELKALIDKNKKIDIDGIQILFLKPDQFQSIFYIYIIEQNNVKPIVLNKIDQIDFLENIQQNLKLNIIHNKIKEEVKFQLQYQVKKVFKINESIEQIIIKNILDPDINILNGLFQLYDNKSIEQFQQIILDQDPLQNQAIQSILKSVIDLLKKPIQELDQFIK